MDKTNVSENKLFDIDKEFMMCAIDQARYAYENHFGGPFGAVIVDPKTEEVVGRGSNSVLADNDPTAHAEINAIKDACKNLHTHDLSGYHIYTTAYPCPMCFGAIQWAHISAVYYGCSLADTADIGFADAKFYSGRQVEEHQICRNRCLHEFNKYQETEHELY